MGQAVMTPAAAIVEAIREAGAELRVVGDEIQARPRRVIPEDLVEAIRRHRGEVVEYLRRQPRALPTDPGPKSRVCAWCHGPLPEDRSRLCADCTGPAPTRRQREATPPRRLRRPAARDRHARREALGIGPARPPAPERRCPSCGGGLSRQDPDASLCGACAYYLTLIHGPETPQ